MFEIILNCNVYTDSILRSSFHDSMVQLSHPNSKVLVRASVQELKSGLGVRSAYYAHTEPGFKFQHPQGRSQLSVSPVPEILMLCSHFCGLLHVHRTQTYTQAHTHKIFYKLQKFCVSGDVQKNEMKGEIYEFQIDI